MDRLLKKLLDIQNINPQDKLSDMLSRCDHDELLECELDLISAAVKPDYEKFKKMIENSQK